MLVAEKCPRYLLVEVDQVSFQSLSEYNNKFTIY